ncbi:MAG: hypothetical protein H9W81_07400 [Enterococcus sp.]|nr:hypothetical protein [Enterococcus sp.]
MLKAHRNENGEIIESILVLAIFVIITMVICGNLMNAIQYRTQHNDGVLLMRQAEQWAVSNPAEMSTLVSSKMSYGELASKTGYPIDEDLQDHRVIYVAKDNNNYQICVSDRETPDEPDFVYETSTDSISHPDNCGLYGDNR